LAESENGAAAGTEPRPVSSQARSDRARIGDFLGAQPEHVGSAGGSLTRRSSVLCKRIAAQQQKEHRAAKDE
jgi:hypothetical protein